jgi:hypothetical protein
MRAMFRVVVAGLLLLLALLHAPQLASAQTPAPPRSSSGPFPVKAGFVLYDVNEVDEERETFEFEGVLVLAWHDPRLAFDPAVEGAAERVFKGGYQFTELFDGWWPQVIMANQSGGFEAQGMVLRILPDGSAWYVEEIDAVAEAQMDLRRFPFDRQSLAASFKVLGYGSEEVRLVADPDLSRVLSQHGNTVGNSEWRIREIVVESNSDLSVIAHPNVVGYGSTLQVRMTAVRNPGHFLRVVVAPLVLLVMLSWCVFWMDRESLGERMDISFIALLTVVAFQIMVEERLPAIPYFTVMSGFLLMNFVLLAASILVNLRVGFLDRTGRQREGDLIDYRCRWLFPAAYLVLCPLLLWWLAMLK